nr:TIGR03943 family protein [Anaeromonas gelatinilytica]
MLMGFAIFFFLTIQSGRVLKYVHPRNVLFIKFAVIAMVLISFFLIPEVFKPQRIRVNSMPLLFFVLPLIMAFLLPAQSFNSNSISYGDLKLERNSRNIDDSEKKIEYSNKSEDKEDIYIDEYSDTKDQSIVDSNDSEYKEDTYVDEYSDTENESIIDSNEDELQLIDGTIIMDSDNYVRWMQEIYENIEKYNGNKIQVTGFVFKDDQFNDNEFVPARMMMVCCAADVQPVGFLCRYENEVELETDTWVKVHGTITKDGFKGNDIPIIEADKVENTAKPEVDYVFPF